MRKDRWAFGPAREGRRRRPPVASGFDLRPTEYQNSSTSRSNYLNRRRLALFPSLWRRAPSVSLRSLVFEQKLPLARPFAVCERPGQYLGNGLCVKDPLETTSDPQLDFIAELTQPRLLAPSRLTWSWCAASLNGRYHGEWHRESSGTLGRLDSLCARPCLLVAIHFPGD